MKGEKTHRVSLWTDVDLAPHLAFGEILDEIALALHRKGLFFDPKPGGLVLDHENGIARVIVWKPPENIVLEFQQAEWEPGLLARIELRFEPVATGTRVTLEYNLPDRLLNGAEFAGWFSSEVLSRFLRAVVPKQFGDWYTDRKARRPSGAQARETYRDPTFHRPNFLAILEKLRLSKADYLIEVGCGGGAFLKEALRSGCRAAAIDHSVDMVRLAKEVNSDAVKEQRLEILESEADKLPFPDSMFTCAVMTGVFGFLPNPAKALVELHRVLAENGRLVLFTGAKELRGTPAAPEPMASRIRFYEDEELIRLTLGAGFDQARVERPDLARFAREGQLPEEAIPLFSGRSGQLLLATKTR